MLFLTLSWAWALVVSLGLGLGLARLLRAGLGPLPALLLASPELLCLTGLAALAWLVAVLSFGLAVALPMQLGLSALSLVGLGLSRAELRSLLGSYGRSWRAAGAGAALLAGVLSALLLTHAAQPPIFPDAALYHAQFVRWLHAYPLVPGLGNLHGRLAFNSHTHLLTAFFSPAQPPAGWPAFQQTAGSFGFLLLVLHHVRRAAHHARPGGRPGLSWFYLGSLLLLLMSLRPWLSSPLPDSLVAVLVLLLLGLLLETPVLPAAGLGWLALLAATGLTWKASGAALLLWPLVGAWRGRAAVPPPSPGRGWAGWAKWPGWGQARRWATLAGGVLLVLLPWLGRNVGLSGYLAYPLAGRGGPVVADWAVPPARLAADLAEIRLFARRPLADWLRADGQSVRAWGPVWWQQQAPADQRLLLLALALAGLVLVLGRLAARPPARWWRRTDYQLYGCLLLGCAAWLATAPALRFAYGYLIGAAVLAPLLALPTLPPRWARAGALGLGALSLAYGLNGLRHEWAKPGALAQRLRWPADYPAPPARVAGQLGPYPLWVGQPPLGRCGNAPLPCTDALPQGLTLRGPTLRQGFRTVPPAPNREGTSAASGPDSARQLGSE